MFSFKCNNESISLLKYFHIIFRVKILEFSRAFYLIIQVKTREPSTRKSVKKLELSDIFLLRIGKKKFEFSGIFSLKIK